MAMSNAERQRKLRERRGAKARVLEPCGTVAAWRRHKRAGEAPCAECDQARRDEQAEQYQARKARKAAEVAAEAAGPDAELLARWGIGQGQLDEGRQLVGRIKSDIRAAARQHADERESWLLTRDLVLSRPERARRVVDMVSGEARWVRPGGWDWLEQVTDADQRRLRRRMVDDDMHTPDVVAGWVRSITGRGFGDDEAMVWLADEWLRIDALRSVASGRLPGYRDPAEIMPADAGADGYRLELLFGADVDEAAGHVAEVLAEAAERYAAWEAAQARSQAQPEVEAF